MVSLREIRNVFDIALGLWPCFLLAALGIVTNILSFAVFARQGLQESATITLAAIAIMDLIKCLVGFVHRLYGLLDFADPVLAINWLRATYMPNVNVQNMAGTMVSVFTMYVTFERCLCVCVPFKVKLLITRRVTLASLTVSAVVVVVTLFPPVLIYEVHWIYDRKINRTIAIYALTNVYHNHQETVNFTNYIFMAWIIITFVIIVLCTSIIIDRLKELGKFRSEHSSASTTNSHKPQRRSKLGPKVVKKDKNTLEANISSNSKEISYKEPDQNFKTMSKEPDPSSDLTQSGSGEVPVTSRESRRHRLSSKDAQLVKMLLLVVLMYVVSAVPRFIVAIGREVEPGLYVGRKYEDIYMIMINCMLALDFVNSSTNLFIYLTMSSHFRQTYHNLFVKKMPHSGLYKPEVN